MTSLDPLRAVAEEISGVGDVARALLALEQRLIVDVERLEVELNQVRKVLGFLATYREFLGNRRAALEAAKEKA
jgi:hypothetical protein